jgi:hypothetical protein
MIRPLLCLGVAFVIFGPSAASAQSDKGGKPAAPTVAENQNPDTRYENFPYRTKLLTEADRAGLADEMGDDFTYAEYARGVIFGRHGRVFVDANIQRLLKLTKWYKPNPKFSNSMLNATERTNLDFVRGIEAAHHSWAQPGDMRWWREKTIPPSDLVGQTLVQIHVMRSEIEAVHGKTFPDEPLIQKYFNERYWYEPSAHYDPKTLNEHERTNITMLARAEAKRSGQALAPGSLLAFGEKTIKPEMLKGVNLYDLRLLRNEIYAIRGGRFRTQWIQDHFDAEDWYTPLPEGQEPKLSSVDQKNVALILNKENELHVALSNHKLDANLLTGMLSDDAGRLRNEIYARRGKVFKDKWLQGYFASMPWYRANPSYSDKLLSSIERENIKTIAKFQDKARTDEQNMAEG